MRSLKMSVIALALIVVSQVAKADENYWEVIRSGFGLDYSKTTPEEREALRVKLMNYINALTADQLLIAGRQCSVVVQQHARQEQWAEAVIGFGCLFNTIQPRLTIFKMSPHSWLSCRTRVRAVLAVRVKAILWDSWSERAPHN